jgi:hypothetical protein
MDWVSEEMSTRTLLSVPLAMNGQAVVAMDGQAVVARGLWRNGRILDLTTGDCHIDLTKRSGSTVMYTLPPIGRV